MPPDSFYHSREGAPAPQGAVISSIIIDGYNLIGTAHGDLARARDDLIRRLAAYRKARRHDLTVVFDGWKSGGRNEETLTAAGIRIIYSRLGDTADAVIRRIVGSDRREWIVVSSDREIASSAWAAGSVPIPSDRFLRALEYATAEDPGCCDSADDEDTTPAVGMKGSPRMLSRKERAVQRALSKL